MAEETARRLIRCATILHETADNGERLQAERFLTELRRSARPYPACLLVLTQSNHAPAQYHALATVKEAMLREWSLLQLSEREQIREQLLDFAVKAQSTLQPLVRNQVLHTSVLIYKRAWLDQDGRARDAFKRRLQGLSEQLSTQPLCLRLCQTAILEFAATGGTGRAASSALGQLWSFHVACHRDFETTVLPAVFAVCARALGAGPAQRQKAVVEEALQTLDALLGWEFEEAVSESQLALRALGATNTAARSREEKKRQEVRPGPGWTGRLVQSRLSEILFQLYPVVQQDKTATHALLQTLIQLASLQGGVFPKEQPKVRSQFVHVLCTGLSSVLMCVVAKITNAAPERKAQSGDMLDKLAQVRSLSHQAGSELLCVSQLYVRMLRSHGLAQLLTLPDPAGVLKTLARLTVSLLQCPATVKERINTTGSECLDVLLEAWLVLVLDWEASLRKLDNSKQAALSNLLACFTSVTSDIFTAYLHRQMALAQQEAMAQHPIHEQFEDASYLGDHLTTIALIARVSAAPALNRLIAAIKERTGALAQHARALSTTETSAPTSTSTSPSSSFFPSQSQPPRIALPVLQEQLLWLVQLLGHVLADSQDGEEPQVPKALLALSRQLAERAAATAPSSASAVGINHAGATADVVLAAPECVFSLLELHHNLLLHHHRQANQSAVLQVLSPLLDKHLVWFIARWSATYLMPDPSTTETILPHYQNKYGEGVPTAVKLLGFFLEKVRVNLLDMPAEAELAAETCALLAQLVQHRIQRKYLAKGGPAWASLLSAFQQMALLPLHQHGAAGGKAKSGKKRGHHATSHHSAAKGMLTLHGPLLVRLVHSFCQASGEAPETEQERAQAVGIVLKPIEQRLTHFLSRPDFAKIALQPTIVQELYLTLEMLCGVARASGPSTFEVGFAFLSRYFEPLLQLLPLYGAHAAKDIMAAKLITQLISLFRDLAETDICFLSPAQSETFMKACLKLVQLYSEAATLRLQQFQRHRTMGRFGHQAKSTQASQEDEEDHFQDISCLLTLLTLITSKDLFDMAEQSVQFASDAALMGLSCLVPHLTQDMLDYPEISQLYFELLHDMVTTYPEKLVILSPQVRGRMLSSVLWAIQHVDPLLARAGFQALAALATLNYERNTGKKKGNVSTPDVAFASFQEDLVKFLPLLFKQVLLCDFSADLLQPAANAVLPLILCNWNEYEGLALGLIRELSTASAAKAPQLANTATALSPTQNTNTNTPAMQARLNESFRKLTQDRGLAPDLSRANKAIFRQNFHDFVQTVRAQISIR